MRNRIITTIIALLLIFASCSDRNINPEKVRSQKSNNNVENFEVFFEKFSTDSVFQQSRIGFPLPVDTYDTDTENFKRSTVSATEWSFFDIKNLGKKILKTSKEKDRITVNIQIEETGVSVNYIFRQQKNDWLLIKIIDEST